MRQALVAATMLCCWAGTAFAQSVESDVTPESEHLVRDDGHFAMSSVVPDKTLEAAQYEDRHDRFSVKFGIVVMPMDYTSFDQDARSKDQVGNQKDELEARSLRLSARGYFELFRTWNYMISYEYKGFDQTSADDWNTTDVRVSTVLGPQLGTLTLGKIKEPFAYEMAGDAANLPHNERLLSPFFRSRNVGATLGNTVLDQRATWAVGWYNDWWTTGEDWSTRAMTLRRASPRCRSGRRRCQLPARRGQHSLLRRRQRPVALQGQAGVQRGGRLRRHRQGGRRPCLAHGPGGALEPRRLLCAGEYVRADLSTRDDGDPTLDGWYVTGSWVLTGEHRPYDRKAAYARRILPQGRWARSNSSPLRRRRPRRWQRARRRDGRLVDRRNWCANNRWKASLGYGNIDLDRFGITGNTKTLLTRLQWIY